MERRGERWLMMGLGLMILGAGLDVRDSHGFGFGGGGRPDGAFLKTLFEEMDADHNGVVTHQEAEQFQAQRFTKADADGDGSLSSAEFTSAEERDETRKQMRRQRLTDIFAQLDENHDGKLSQAELVDLGMQRFKLMDRNGDGTVTTEELQAKRRVGPRF